MLKRCSNCKYCYISLNALRLGIIVYKCGSFDTSRRFINFPFGVDDGVKRGGAEE